jgi:hypothetical protein
VIRMAEALEVETLKWVQVMIAKRVAEAAMRWCIQLMAGHAACEPQKLGGSGSPPGKARQIILHKLGANNRRSLCFPASFGQRMCKERLVAR